MERPGQVLLRAREQVQLQALEPVQAPVPAGAQLPVRGPEVFRPAALAWRGWAALHQAQARSPRTPGESQPRPQVQREYPPARVAGCRDRAW